MNTGFLDRIDDFNLDGNADWLHWIREFKLLLRAAACDELPDSRRIAFLLVKCRGFTRVLNALDIDEETIEFDAMVSELTHYFKPVNARAVFFNRKQGEDETFDNFAQDLKFLSHPCRFLDPMIVRDAFLSNMDMKHAEIKRLIQSKYDPSFEEALALANTMMPQGCIPKGEKSRLTLGKAGKHSALKSSGPTQRSEDSSSGYRNRGANNGILNGQQHSALKSSGPRQRSEDSSSGYRNRGANNGILNGQQHSALKSSGPRQRSEDSSSGYKNRGANNGIVNGQQHSAFAASKSKDAGKSVLPYQSEFAPRLVEPEINGGAGNTNASGRQPAELRPAGKPRDSCPIQMNQYTQVRITHKSPEGNLFCVCANRMDGLDELCEELSGFAERGSRSTLAETQEGDLCLAHDEFSGWVRAEIVSARPPTGRLVRIRYIDVGGEDNKHVSRLFVLPQSYWGIEAYAFRIKVPRGVNVQVNDELTVMPDFQSQDGVWTMKVRTQGFEETPARRMTERATSNEDRRAILPPSCEGAHALDPAAAPSFKPAASQPAPKRPSVRTRTADSPRRPHPPPIPKHTFTWMTITHCGPEGIFAVASSKKTHLAAIQSKIGTLKLRRLGGPPEINLLCVAPYKGELFRALITQVIRKDESCRVTFVDYGNESQIPTRELQCIPNDLCGHIYTFKVRFHPQSAVEVEFGTELQMAPVALEADGSWLVQIQGEPTTPEHALPSDDDVVTFEHNWS